MKTMNNTRKTKVIKTTATAKRLTKLMLTKFKKGIDFL